MNHTSHGRPAPDSEEDAFLEAMIRIVDRALADHRGGSFVYGIHQELSSGMVDALRARYEGSGWSAVSIEPTATGAFLLVLRP
jgi:hypothetical protein